MTWQWVRRIRRCGGLVAVAVLAAACSRRDRPSASARIDSARPATATIPAVPDTGRSAVPWLGFRFANLPDSIPYLAADTVTVNDTTYGWRDVIAGGTRWLWLSIGRGQGPSGAAEWTVVAAMPVTVVDDERIFMAECRKDAKPDHLIVALGLWDDAPLFKRIHRAWRVNPVGRRFDEIPVAGIDCVNTDRGE